MTSARAFQREQMCLDVIAMRKHRCKRWGDIEIDLAPDVPEEPTQPSISPEERERRAREERRAIAMRSSGGPVRRLSGDRE